MALTVLLLVWNNTIIREKNMYVLLLAVMMQRGLPICFYIRMSFSSSSSHLRSLPIPDECTYSGWIQPMSDIVFSYFNNQCILKIRNISYKKTMAMIMIAGGHHSCIRGRTTCHHMSRRTSSHVVVRDSSTPSIIHICISR